MKEKIKDAIDEIGYTNENVENKERHLVTFFVEGDFKYQEIEDEMYDMVQSMDDVLYHNAEISSVENGDSGDGAFVTFQECDALGAGRVA